MCTHACCFFLLKLGTCHCLFDIDVYQVRELAEKESEDGIFKMLSIDVTWFLTTIHIGTTVVNIGATAPVTKAATTIFGEAGVSAATGVMTVAVLLLTEITPKSIAVHNVTEAARFVAEMKQFTAKVVDMMKQENSMHPKANPLYNCGCSILFHIFTLTNSMSL
ncbi:DUF21 domain-containing protein At1g55930, chloroplastic-like isoform X1 [Camellia sinensis]|uniref:DUF21 domain-containing protein At1g55930, chloroplastic-like isoform X1 n=1 Tax=Camellia sinensis TaxID=4442 RepID=UPI001035FA2C|nr:DUF21 domain-containing protein At1g55930, chloroplastic-like isoform X1 [Camellia sinensis]